MKNFYQILIIFFAVGCNLSTKENKPNKAEDKEVIENCTLKTFEQSYSENITVNSVYYDCESDWKFRLQIQVANNIIYHFNGLRCKLTNFKMLYLLYK